MSKWEYSETELWRFNEDNISVLHVFGSIAIKNTVLVYAEAREGQGRDAGELHSIWMRRSTDGGRTFSPTECILPAGSERSLSNAVTVYDEEIGRLFLVFDDNWDNLHTKNFIIYSDDLGLTWSDEISINHILESGADPMPFHLAGPGHGVQLTQGAHAGRLIIPFWHRRYSPAVPAAERGYCVSMLYSDDHGATWQHSDYLAQECQGNESRIAETKEGLIWVLRTSSGNPVRYASFSYDGGDTWSKPAPMAMSPANNCDAGVVTIQAKEGYDDMVLISRISSPELPARSAHTRWNMEVLISLDGGHTFPDSMRMPVGDATPGYSDMCVIKEEEPVAGLIHCRNNHVLFSRISLQALTGGKYENTTRRVWI